MREVAADVHLTTGFPPYAIDCYLVGDVLVDAMTRRDANHILEELNGRTVSAHAITGARPGGLRRVRPRRLVVAAQVDRTFGSSRSSVLGLV